MHFYSCVILLHAGSLLGFILDTECSKLQIVKFLGENSLRETAVYSFQYIHALIEYLKKNWR